ncbi:hypothetical protein FXO38_22771 [Capsicum annuum]|nr:hypothetical protein FXO38_22771 [Capsicum annuum]
MQNFSLWLGYYHPRLCFIENWIKILVACNIKEVNLRERPGYVYYSFYVGETLPKLEKVNLVNLANQENLGYDHSVLQLIDIAAINVEDLSINNHSHGNINAVRVTDCKALKSLCLNCVDITDNWLEELFYSLQNLEKFDLICCKTLKTMKITSKGLKQLRVFDCCGIGHS